jgi:chemotaxis protein CheD
MRRLEDMPTTTSTAERGYFDQRFNARIINVVPGGQEIAAAEGDVLSTVLGSCVAACLRDPVARVGGMNHFLLPGEDAGQGGPSTDDMRFGAAAMEFLINALIKRGGLRSRMEAKIFGGAVMIAGSAETAVGSKNADFVQRFLAREGIPVAAKDLGGQRPRRVNYEPATGRAWINWLAPQRVSAITASENSYRRTLSRWDQTSSLEIF